MWLHVLLPLSLLRWLLRDVRPTWGGVYTAYTPTHCALCITQLVCSGLKVLNVQNQQESSNQYTAVKTSVNLYRRSQEKQFSKDKDDEEDVEDEIELEMDP